METVKVKVTTRGDEYAPVVPVVVPDLDEVRAFAARLHAEGMAWKGEAFGWSSLVGPEVYSATAQCKEPTRFLKIEAGKLKEVLEKDPANAAVFYRRLARILGNRLIQAYKVIAVGPETDTSTSFGTRQVMESEATTE